MNKLRIQIVFAVNLFLLTVLGGMLLFYLFFAEDYYIMRKKALMNDAFETISQFDLNHMSPADEAVMETFEEESFSLLICNDKFQSVYSSKIMDVEILIDEKVAAQKELYTEQARACQYTDELGKPIVLYGRIAQRDSQFYVYISENTRVMRRSIAYANKFLIYILIVAVILGTVFAWFLARWIVRPIEKIQHVTTKLSQNDFSVRLPERQPNNEVGKLAGDINCMAEKIQRNINDLNNYNYLLLRQNRNLSELEEMRKKMVGNITHELKTPLAIISSQVELLQYEYDVTKKEYYFDSIMEEIDKMSLLISSILQNAKIEQQIQKAELVPTDLSGLLESLLPKYESWLVSGGIDFTSSIERGCTALADPMQIEQALNNYMMNAKRHTHSGRRVVLSLRSEPDGFLIALYNEGNRLSEEEQSAIWTGFYQAGKGQNGNTAEIGLGLYIVKDIMNRHGGACGVRNKDHGVEFWMKIQKEKQESARK